MSSLNSEHLLFTSPVYALPCKDGQSWDWDGVRFEVLHPTEAQYAAPTRKTNDMSCVLKLATAHGSALLTSDIEALSERALLARKQAKPGEQGDVLRSDVLIAPHHGSRTSSTPEFIAAVGARAVIFPVGYRNRFGHPRQDVVERYRLSGAALHRTDRDGALTLHLARPDHAMRIVAERDERRRYWHGR